MPHSTRNNGLIERQVRWTFYITFGPPRSYDFTPLDLFVWGYVKAHVYTDKPSSIDALEDNIEAFIRWEGYAKILLSGSIHMRRNYGQNLHEIIFKH